MGRGRKRGDHDARRVQIAEATCKVILRAGVDGAGVADIAREMGCSTGVLMHYYSSKAQMLLFAKNLLFDRVYEKVAQALRETRGLEKLTAMAREMLPLDARSTDCWRVLTAFNGLAIGNSSLTRLQARRDSRFARIFATAIRELQSERILPKRLDSLSEGRGMTALIDGVSGQVVMNSRSWSAEQAVALLNRHIQSLTAKR